MIPKPSYLLLAALCFTGQSLAQQPAKLTDLPRSTPAAQGVAAKGIVDFLDNLLALPTVELHSVMLLCHGKVIAEGWSAPYGPQFRHTLYSLSKSFTSTAVGLAVAEGKLTVDDKALSFFPDKRPATLSPQLEALRVRDLLSMSAGNTTDPTFRIVQQQDWAKAFLADPFTNQPGSTFLYNSGATYLCSAIVQKLTGQKVVDYLKPRLFDPLGIVDASWEECPMGVNTGGWGLSLRTEDIAKFGQLLLQKGKWHGQQIVPEAWVNEATSFKIQQSPNPGSTRSAKTDDWQQGYCYQFWRCQHRAFRGDGAYGQFMVVMPEQDAVLVMTSHSGNLQGQLDLAWKHLLPAMQDPMTSNPAAEAALTQKLANLRMEPITGSKDNALNETLQGAAFTLEPNALGLRELSFDFHAAGPALSFKGEKEHRVEHAWQDWKLGDLDLPGTPPRIIAGGAPKQAPVSPVGAAAAWTDKTTLLLKWQYRESAHHDLVTCDFAADGKSLTLTFRGSPYPHKSIKQDPRPVLKGNRK
jgi:CubicO group peptidase (beta-lactamase class C family)